MSLKMRYFNKNHLIIVCAFVIFISCFLVKHDFGTDKRSENDDEKVARDASEFFHGRMPKESKTGTIYDHRLQTMANACKQSLYHHKSKLKLTKRKYLLYSKRNNFLFCFVQKIGCTFWKKTFVALEQLDIGVLPDLSLIHKVDIPRLPRKLNDSEVIRFSEQAFTALFVRDPYERLFSGYVDKFVYPNPHYWINYGTLIVQKYRPNATEQSLHCGHDVTFPEFVSYVTDADEYKPKFLDDHFSPIHYHCRPCEVKYKFIGKMETFENDVNHVMHTLNFANMSTKRNSTEELVQIAQDLERYRTVNRTCLNPGEISDRVAMSLKYRGLVKNGQKLNFQNLTPKNVGSYTNKIAKNSLKSQKRSYMVKHFKSLGEKLLKRVQEFLKADCELFGYENKPSDIFQSVL